MRAALAACVIVLAACSGKPAPPPPAPKAPTVWSSPGPLAMVHATLEQTGQCNACHVDNTPAIASQKCLDCHEHGNLRARIGAGRGLHASAAVKGKPCNVCHEDHKGQSYDLTGWSSIRGGMAGFDHALSGWPLHGGHVTAPCDKCHTRRDRQGLLVFMGTEKLCGACHQQQPHGFQRRELLACERCHGEAAWKPPLAQLRFDHDDRKDTRYPIGPAHAQVACDRCHSNNVFSSAKQGARCEVCHAPKSPHKNAGFGIRSCEECHTALSWKQVTFDHGFSLGKHKGNPSITCYSCHPNGRITANECERCHAKDSKHQLRFAAFGRPAPHCATCHPMTSWKPTAFDHRKETTFALTHGHASLRCRSCHRGTAPDQFEKLGTAGATCAGCHAHALVHDGKYKNDQCLKCHDITSVPPSTPRGLQPIHGAQGTFPLADGHKVVPCVDCHTRRGATGKPAWDGVGRECSGCHPDSHQGKNGLICSRCHDPGVWKPKTS